MKHPAYRLRKYAAKMNPDTIRQRFADQKDTMVEQEESLFGELALIEAKAQVICMDAGIPTGQIPQYLNMARKCWKYGKKFASTTKDNAVLNFFNYKVAEGLNATVLAGIAALCGTTIAGY
jgi:hypothetical protein